MKTFLITTASAVASYAIVKLIARTMSDTVVFDSGKEKKL